MIYKETLTAPEGTLLRCFTPPPLLCASRRLRDEALPLFYKYNHFEITVKQNIADKTLAPGLLFRLPNVERRVWLHFLDMWKVFSVSGTNGLQYVERLTVVYQLYGQNGYSFGNGGAYDRRLCFRFSRAPLEDVVEGRSEEVIQNSSEDCIEDSIEGSSWGSNEGSDGESDYDSRDGVIRRHVALLNRGTFDWPSLLETQRLLFDKIRENGKSLLQDHKKFSERGSSPAF